MMFDLSLVKQRSVLIGLGRSELAKVDGKKQVLMLFLKERWTPKKEFQNTEGELE